MKYYLLSTFILFNISYSTAQEQKDSTFKWHSNNIIKINAIGLFSNYLELNYERVITNKYSVSITYGNGKEYKYSGKDAEQNYNDKYGGYSFNYILGNTEQSIKINNHIGIEFRYYLSHKNNLIPAGFHLGPSLNFLSYNEKFTFYDETGTEKDSRENKYNITSIGVTFGPQLLIHRMVAIDIFVTPGIGILSSTEGDLSSANKESYTGAGFTISFGIFLGFAIGK